MTEPEHTFSPGTTRRGRPAGGGRRPAAAPAIPEADVDALYRVVAGRRDIRNGFLPDPMPTRC